MIEIPLRSPTIVGMAVETIVPSTALKNVAMNRANVTIPLFVFLFEFKLKTPNNIKISQTYYLSIFIGEKYIGKLSGSQKVWDTIHFFE